MPYLMHAKATRLILPVCAMIPCMLSTGCTGGEPMRVESKLDGTVTTVLKLDGPLQMQLQGPIVRYEGVYISDELFERVDSGDTTDDWLIAVFGEPTGRATLRDGTEIWRWTYRPIEQSGSVVELLGGDDQDPKLATRAVFVQLRAGRVIEKWKG